MTVFDVVVRPRPKFTVLLLVLAAAAIFAGPTQAAPLHPTKIEESCGYGGGSDLPEVSLYGCDIIVTDTSESGGTPPTGEVTYPDGGHLCDLLPSSNEPVSSCGILWYIGRSAPSGTIEYRGDPEHAPSSFTLTYGTASPTPPPATPPVSTPGPSYAPASVGRAPRSRIFRRPSRRTRNHLARFVFATNGAHEYRLDGGDWIRCGAKLSRRVATGHHTLRVRTVGVAGQMPSKPTIFSWRVLP